MKLLILLTIIACLQTSARGFGQTVTLSLENAPLEKAFKEIKKQTGYSFVYTRIQLKNALPVNCQIKNGDLKEVLELCFRNQPLSYLIEDRYIVVQTKTTITQPSTTQALLLDINGSVVNENGEPLAGATIITKNSNKATSTNDRGEFSLKEVSENDLLIITSVGYYRKEIEVNKQNSFLIRLRIAIGDLDETVVVAYGKVTRRLNTGNVSKVTADEIGRQPVSNPLSAIQGRAAGVFVSTQNGLPGGNISVIIRGKGSINAGTDPLYVVDGVPFISTPLNATMSVLSTGIGGSTSPLNSINPSDIESIEILKDADATALYGSRAANGVILITTKKGKSGETKFDFNIYHGISRVANLPKLTSLKEYLSIRREAFQNDGIVPTSADAPDLLEWDTTKATDWSRYILGGTAAMTEVKASVSGGNESTNFLISGTYRNEGTVLPGDQNYNKATAHIKLQHASPNKKFSLNFTSIYSSDKNNLISSSIFEILTLPPNFPLYDNAGNFTWAGFFDPNPAAMLTQKSISQTENLLSNLILKYAITPNLIFKSSLGYSTIKMDQVMIYPTASINPNFGQSGYAYYGSNKNKIYLIEPQIEYHKKSKSSNIQVLLGASWQNSIREGSFISGSNYSNDALLEYAGAARDVAVTNLFVQYKYASVFSRLHYDYKEKYILNVSLRRDGSSRFGPGNQYGNFGAVGLGWVFTKESLFKNVGFINYGKIRASYGITGNDQIADYQYLSTYGTGPVYQGTSGLNPSRIANSDFKWETNKKLEIGLELSVLKERLQLIGSWYRNHSGNQLINYPLPFVSGPFGSYLANLPALIENKGLEFEFNLIAINNKKLLFSFFGNITIPKNKLLKYPGLSASSLANKYVIGEDLSIKRAFRFTGVNPQTGIPEYLDIDNNGSISSPADLTTIGRSSPYFFGGFGTTLRISNFSFNLFFQYTKQYAQGIVDLPGSRQNYFIGTTTHWNKPGDISTLPKATTNPTSEYYNLGLSDAAFFNAAYVRLKNISLSYLLPSSVLSRLKIQNCRFYIEGQNLLTWGKQSNLFDPETALGGIPPLSSFVGGVQLTF